MQSQPESLIREAAEALRRGELVAMPTETVYGLAADARNPEALRRVFALKGRPSNHPLIVHLPDARQLGAWAREVPEAAQRLAAAFWPGPLTLVLPVREDVPVEVTGGQDSIALRVPAHPLARALLEAFGGGVAAPSANRFGRVSPTRAEDVRAEFGGALPLVLDGGPCPVGIESTIVDLCSPTPAILRPGMISAEKIAALIGPLGPNSGYPRPRAPGMLARHYAPATPVRQVDRATLERIVRDDAEVRVLALDTLPHGAQGIALPARPEAYARGLYAALRELDRQRARELLVESPPDRPDWLAIRDRLGRAGSAADGTGLHAPR